LETSATFHAQSPVIKGAQQLWTDTKQLATNIARLGLPRTSIQNKCPHYE
jgi:hypothetical protein